MTPSQTPLLGALSLSWVVLSGAAHAEEVPRLDHVIVVVMENKNYEQALTAPYISSLVAGASSFSDYHAITHPSQPNYLALWAGRTLGVSDDDCPAPGSPFTAENLGHAAEAAGLSWHAYVEDLPSVGSDNCKAHGEQYARKHNPWTNFANLNHQNERPYADLAKDIAEGELPNLAFVTPNQCHDMHSCPLAKGDAWLSRSLPAMLEAVGPQGIVVLTWDEDDDGSSNHVLTLVAGGPVKTGYVSPRKCSHYTLLRTICDALKLPAFGAARSETPITDIWRGRPRRPAQMPKS